MSWFPRDLKALGREFKPPSAEEAAEPLSADARMWARLLAEQVESVRERAAPLAGFLEGHFTPALIDYVARGVEKQMADTRSSGSANSLSFRQIEAWHVVLTTPVRKDAAREWFARTYDGYLAFLEPYWSYYPGRWWGGPVLNWAVICQTTFGAPGWCEVAIVPAKWCQELPAAWPEEFLTEDEIRSMGMK
jgi:hypothetical protein